MLACTCSTYRCTAWHPVERSPSTGEAANVGFGENLPRLFFDRARDRGARCVAIAAASARFERGYARCRLGGIELLFSQGEIVRCRVLIPLVVFMPLVVVTPQVMLMPLLVLIALVVMMPLVVLITLVVMIPLVLSLIHI